MARITAGDVINFWFVECEPKHWYQKDEKFDAEISTRFGETIELALKGELDHWADEGESCLALILLLDQFTRNVFRDTPKAFAGDEKAILLSQKCVDQGYLQNAQLVKRNFMLMPMMHSEDIAVQEASLPLFKEWAAENTYEFAIKHRDIVAKFNRFPHRNAILGRQSSAAEQAFLTQPGSSF